MKKFRTPKQEESGALIAMIATIFGGWVRLFAPWVAGFPLNDGGLFHSMILTVRENQYRLPQYVEYNGLSIPFAYPAFGFYIGAFLSQITGASPVEILRWLPAIISVGTIPAFYWLAKSLLGSSFKAGIATFIYAFIPRAMSWALMGGGLTRSFGLLFLLLTLASIHALFKNPNKKFLFASILFSALTILSHPEAAIHTVAFSILIWIFEGRNKQGILNALSVGLGTLILTAPWWLTLLIRFGLDPILAATGTGFHSAIALLIPFVYILTDEPSTTFIAVLGVIGLAINLRQGKFLLPVAYLLPFVVEPRSAPVYAMIPLGMLAAAALSDVILPVLTHLPGRNLVLKIFVPYLALYMIGNAFYFDTQFAGTSVSPANREAFEWIKTNTPPKSRFLILTGETDVFCDGIPEWFPALTGQTSLTTIQGTEWLPGKFAPASQLQRDMQGCLNEMDSFACVEEQAKQAGIQYDYLYIANQSTLKSMCRVIQPISRGSELIRALESDKDFAPVYQTDKVSIFLRKR
ncbi:hypothetical protein ANAEL_04482 [Anaerolineales bacterium]|nr:hypothetical protein ANAEL_04482 [Anaerolineales bacterium]